MSPLHAELDAALPDIRSWRALPDRERLGRPPWTDGVEIPPALDARLQRTPWGDWADATAAVANERLWELLQGREELDVVGTLAEGECFSPSDERFTLQNSVVRRRGALRRKLLDDVPEAERFQRYLPVLDRQALSSTEPKLDLRAQIGDAVQIVGWVDALGIQQEPNDRLFVIQLRGDIVDSDATPLADGDWLVMELRDQVIPGADADALNSLARFIEKLPPPQRTRSGDPDRLDAWVKRRFQPQPSPPSPDLPPQLDGLSQLELTEAGLIWLLRLEPLPAFIDTLQLAGAAIAAEQVRGRVGRITVPPSAEPFTLGAGPLTPLLQPFEHPPLPLDRATVFRFDSAGRAVRQLGSQVQLNQRIRLLLPPGIPAPAAASSLWVLGVWTACELTARPDLPAELGLSIASERIEVHWETAPQRWIRLPDGLRIPVFGGGQRPTLQVQGTTTQRGGELNLTTVQGSTPLPAGDRWTVLIEEAPVGQHGLEVTPAAMDTIPARRAFGITDEPPPVWPSDVAVEPEGQADLLDWPLQVSGPPLWPVRVGWEGSRHIERNLHIGPDGRLPLEAVEIDTRVLRREPLGRMVFDFGELGEHVVVHVRKERVSDIQVGLDKYLESVQGADLLLMEKLAERLLGTLGWVLKDGVASRAALGPDGLLFEPVAALVVAHAVDEDARHRADVACEEHGLQAAFVVAGHHWLRHVPDALFAAPVLNATEQREELLRTFHWRSR